LARRAALPARSLLSKPCVPLPGHSPYADRWCRRTLFRRAPSAGPKFTSCRGRLGLVDTVSCAGDEPTARTLVIDSAPAGITAIGDITFAKTAIDWLVAEADLDATIVALPDAFLNLRLAGSGPDPAAIAAQLQARGVNPLISGAFEPRNAA